MTYLDHLDILVHFLYLQEGDQFTAESAPSCHRCPATKQNFLSTDCPLAMKTTKDTRAAVTAAASGDGLRALGMQRMGPGPVVEWNEDGSCVRPGPESSHYEAGRSECGAHLLFNAFWTVAHCCVHQLLLRDSMHQIDLGVIIRLIMAILRKYWDDVLQFLKDGSDGLAAKKLQERLLRLLARRVGKDGKT
jgi:hypothetical protein